MKARATGRMPWACLAKSGVGGGIVAVVPGVMGIAAFSPPLDSVGNSVRGQKMVAHVAQALGYNLFKGQRHDSHCYKGRGRYALVAAWAQHGCSYPHGRSDAEHMQQGAAG